MLKRLNEIIRNMKGLAYKYSGSVECVAYVEHLDSFVPVETIYLPEEKHGDKFVKPRIVFGPIGTKALLARRAAEAERQKKELEEANLLGAFKEEEES